MILFLTNQDPQTSRNRSLINFIENDYNKSYNILLLSKKSFFNIFFEIYNKIKIYKPKKIIIGYNSRTLTLTIYLLKIFFNFHLIYDLGYPISDIPKLSFKRRFLLNIFDYYLIKISDLIIVESKEQKEFIELKCKKPVLVYYAYFNFPTSLRQIKLLDFKYFLFRGRLNYESGILLWIEEFIKYKKNGTYKLVILGFGELESDVKALIKNNPKDIIFLNKYVDESDLISIISNASCLLGQINSNEFRLQKTLPHKFFESIFFQKVYLGYLYPPVKTIIGTIYYESGLQLDPNDAVVKISELFINFESIDQNLLKQKVEIAYCLFQKNHINNNINFVNFLQSS